MTSPADKVQFILNPLLPRPFLARSGCSRAGARSAAERYFRKLFAAGWPCQYLGERWLGLYLPVTRLVLERKIQAIAVDVKLIVAEFMIYVEE